MEYAAFRKIGVHTNCARMDGGQLHLTLALDTEVYGEKLGPRGSARQLLIEMVAWDRAEHS